MFSCICGQRTQVGTASLFQVKGWETSVTLTAKAFPTSSSSLFCSVLVLSRQSRHTQWNLSFQRQEAALPSALMAINERGLQTNGIRAQGLVKKSTAQDTCSPYLWDQNLHTSETLMIPDLIKAEKGWSKTLWTGPLQYYLLTSVSYFWFCIHYLRTYIVPFFKGWDFVGICLACVHIPWTQQYSSHLSGYLVFILRQGLSQNGRAEICMYPFQHLCFSGSMILSKLCMSLSISVSFHVSCKT